MKNYSIPILFVIFNRKEIAQISFESIRRQKPLRLYIACDGARANKIGEAEIVEDIRKSIVESVDWECDVKTLFQSTNLGCGKGVLTAINWLFQNEKFGIIIEDDCICNESFFKFMEYMLIKYEEENRIGMVAGSNLIEGYLPTNSSYFFSRYKSCWGWGTWKRAWDNMDIDMKWRETDFNNIICNSGYYGRGKSKWKYQLKCIDSDYVSAWDWQWYYTLSAQNQLCIYPKVNLVSNIGVGKDATHTSRKGITKRSFELAFPLCHPKYIVPNESFDRCFYHSENTLRSFVLRIIPLKVKSYIKQIFKI